MPRVHVAFVRAVMIGREGLHRTVLLDLLVLWSLRYLDEALRALIGRERSRRDVTHAPGR